MTRPKRGTHDRKEAVLPATTCERIPPASWRDVRAVLLGTALCLVAINAAAVWFLAHYSPNRGARVTKFKWELVDRPPAGADWLVLGDSSGLRGVVPAVLNEQLGVRSLNLCTTRQMLAIADVWMLERYIKRHGPPRGVLLVHVWEVWQGDRDWLVSVMSEIPMRWGFWEHLDPPLRLTTAEQWRVFLSRYVPLYADNQSLAQTVRYPWKVARYLHSIGVDETGYMPVKSASARQVEEDLHKTVEAVRGQTFRMSGLNRLALERVRALAEQHGFDVYVANSPLYEGLYRNPDFLAYFQQVDESLRAFADASPRVHYIAQKPWTFPRDQMENCDHVTAAASPDYTRKLAEEMLRIRRGRAGGDLSASDSGT